MSALQNYVDQKNQWGAIFGDAPLSLALSADRQRIAGMLDSDLSPENLSCDGELSGAEQSRRYRVLRAAALELKAVDPTVKFYEFG